MGLNRKRLLTALYFSNRIIQRNFPLRTFIAPNVGNSFMGAHSFSSANALYLHGVCHPSLPTGALTVAVALLTSRLFVGVVAARRKPHEPFRQRSCSAAYFERSLLIRLRRFLSFARSFLATAFLIMFMPASGLGSVGAGMEEILSSSASICREISSAPFALFLIRTPGPPPFSAMNSTPAFSSAAMIFSPVSGRPPSSPPVASSRLIVGVETPDDLAIASCDQPNNSRAALIC